MNGRTPFGPNVRNLFIERVAQLMIERAGPGNGEFGIPAGIAVRIHNGGLKQDWMDAGKWVHDVLAAVKAAPDNPYKSDEEIAAAVLRELGKRRASRKGTE